MPQIYTPDPSLRDEFVRYLSSDSAAERAAIIEQLRDETPEKLAEFVLLVSQPRNDQFLDPPNVAIKPTSVAPHAVDATSMLEETTSSNIEQRYGADDQSGEQIGTYKLLQQIGEGGFGTVYMAQQTQPVRRKVALKVIKPGMDSSKTDGDMSSSLAIGWSTRALRHVPGDLFSILRIDTQSGATSLFATTPVNPGFLVGWPAVRKAGVIPRPSTAITTPSI